LLQTRLETSRKAASKNRHAKRTREVGAAPISKGTKTIEIEAEATAPRIEPVENAPVSPEYEEKWNEILRQTMTKKQLKNLLEPGSEEETK
jgi:hypothetical protein